MRRVRWPVRVLSLSLTVALTPAPGGEAAAQVAKGGAAPQTPPRTPASATPSRATDASVKPAAQPPDAAPAAKPAAEVARMKELLKAWETQSSRLKTLDVGIEREDESPAWGKEKYKGRALFKEPNFAWLDFHKFEKVEGKETFVPYERIICTGNEFWQYRSDTKQVFIFPIQREQQGRSLEEGPLPFLFNMKAGEAEQRYDMSLMNETKDYFAISVRPRWKKDAEGFQRAFLQLDKATFLPSKIYLVSPDGKSTQKYSLVQVKPNAAVADENFKGIVLGAPWTVHRDPGGEGAGPSGVRPASGTSGPGVGRTQTGAVTVPYTTAPRGTAPKAASTAPATPKTSR